MVKIFIVEDEADIRENLQELLIESGYQVEQAENGEEAFSKILEWRPDVIICDINMPKMNGYELIGALSQHLGHEEFPVYLFLSARVESSDITKGLKLGADDFIIKPYKFQELVETIKMRLKKRKILSQNQNYNQGPDITNFKKLALPYDEGLRLISYENIVMCEAQRAYCKFYLIDGAEILVSKPMKHFEALLEKHGFMRLHKSNIINPVCITKYVRSDGGYVVLNDSLTASVSSSKKHLLEKFLQIS